MDAYVVFAEDVRVRRLLGEPSGLLGLLGEDDAVVLQAEADGRIIRESRVLAHVEVGDIPRLGGELDTRVLANERRVLLHDRPDHLRVRHLSTGTKYGRDGREQECECGSAPVALPAPASHALHRLILAPAPYIAAASQAPYATVSHSAVNSCHFLLKEALIKTTAIPGECCVKHKITIERVAVPLSSVRQHERISPH